MYKALSAGAVRVKRPLLEEIELAARHGFGGLEVSPVAAEEIGVEKVRDAMARHELKNAGFGLSVAFRNYDDEFRRTLAQFPQQVKTAARLGAKQCATYIMPFHDVYTYEQNYEIHHKTLTACAEILNDYGIMLSLEFVGPRSVHTGKPHIFLHTLPDMLTFCRSIPAGNAGLLLDAYHVYTASHSLEAVAQLKASEIGLVHIADAHDGMTLDNLPDTSRRLPGETGVIDLKAFLNVLRQIGYQGGVVVEPFSAKLADMTDDDEKLTAVMDSINCVWGDEA